MFYRPPSPVDDEEESDEWMKPKPKVHSLILRIVTIGKYVSMIENSIIHHSDLIRRYLQCDYFIIHLVVEKPLNLDRKFPGLVREIPVPKEYKTKTGSLGKARNLAYWSQTNQLGDSPADRTWIIDLDEDVILTKSFMRSLSQSFFQDQSEPKIGLPQALIKFKEDCGYLNKWIQIFRFSFDLIQHWPSMILFKRPPGVCHGGCFVARADCSMDLNAECGQFCSISDDNAYILSMINKGVKLEFIGGWFYEDAPTSTSAAIIQRTRWQRGHLYLAMHAPVSKHARANMIFFTFGSMIVLPISSLVRLFFAYLAITGKWGEFLPAGVERPYIGDTMTACVLATYIFTLIYGSWYLLDWREAIWYSLFALTGIPLALLHACDFLIACLALVEMVKDALRGSVTWTVTQKDEKCA